MNIGDHIEPEPPDPKGKPMMSYPSSVPCPYCGDKKRHLWGTGKRRRVLCGGCYQALWPVLGDASQAREPNSGGQRNLI